jgi:hypothetical protein
LPNARAKHPADTHTAYLTEVEPHLVF